MGTERHSVPSSLKQIQLIWQYYHTLVGTGRHMALSRNDVAEAVEDRQRWRQRLTQCVTDVGWTKVKVNGKVAYVGGRMFDEVKPIFSPQHWTARHSERTEEKLLQQSTVKGLHINILCTGTARCWVSLSFPSATSRFRFRHKHTWTGAGELGACYCDLCVQQE